MKTPRGDRPGLKAIARTLVALAWTVVIAKGFAQGPPPGSPGGDFTGIATRPPAISGTVVDAGSGVPIPGAVVSVGVGDFIMSRQQADENGRFLFSNLTARTPYEVTAGRPGYFDGAFGREVWNGSARRIVLSEDQWESDVRVPLFRPSGISGRVVDEAGGPVAGARVLPLAQITVAGVVRLASGPAAVTDDRGAYRIAPLPPGTYAVVLPPGASGDSMSHPMTFYPAARTLEGARVLTLGPNDERTGVDITLEAAAAFSVSGRIEPLLRETRGLQIRLVPQHAEGLGASLLASVTTVGEDGRFTFSSVPNGSYVVLASPSQGAYELVPPGAAPTDAKSSTASTSRTLVPSGPPETWLTLIHGSDSPYAGRSTVTVAGRDVSDVILPLRRGSAIRGRVVAEDNVGVRGALPPIVRGEGLSVSHASSLAERGRERLQAAVARLSGTQVVLEPADGDPRLGLPRTRTNGTLSPADFSITGVLPGAYLLRSWEAGVKSVRWNGQDYTHTPLTVTGGQDITGVEIVVDRLPPEVGGTVQDEQYRDALDATVLVFPVDRSRWLHTGLNPIALRSTLVGHGGGYRLSALPPGEYYFVAIAGQLIPDWQDRAFLERLAGVATRATVQWGQVQLPNLVVVTLPR